MALGLVGVWTTVRSAVEISQEVRASTQSHPHLSHMDRPWPEKDDVNGQNQLDGGGQPHHGDKEHGPGNDDP